MNMLKMRRMLPAMLLVFGCGAANAQQTSLPVIPLNIGMYVIEGYPVTAVGRIRR
jgi:hypothetical protein